MNVTRLRPSIMGMTTDAETPKKPKKNGTGDTVRHGKLMKKQIATTAPAIHNATLRRPLPCVAVCMMLKWSSAECRLTQVIHPV